MRWDGRQLRLLFRHALGIVSSTNRRFVLCGTAVGRAGQLRRLADPLPATHLLSVGPCLRQAGGNREAGGRQLGIYGGNTECASTATERWTHGHTQQEAHNGLPTRPASLTGVAVRWGSRNKAPRSGRSRTSMPSAHFQAQATKALRPSPSLDQNETSRDGPPFSTKPVHPGHALSGRDGAIHGATASQGKSQNCRAS